MNREEGWFKEALRYKNKGPVVEATSLYCPKIEGGDKEQVQRGKINDQVKQKKEILIRIREGGLESRRQKVCQEIEGKGKKMLYGDSSSEELLDRSGLGYGRGIRDVHR